MAAEWYLLGVGQRPFIPTTLTAVKLEMTLQTCLRQEPETMSLYLHTVIIQGPNMQKIQALILWQNGGRVLAKGMS